MSSFDSFLKQTDMIYQERKEDGIRKKVIIILKEFRSDTFHNLTTQITKEFVITI